MFVLKRSGDAGSVNQLAFTPDGRHVLTGAPAGSLNCWTVAGDHVWNRSARGGVYGLAVAAGGTVALTAGDRLGAFRVADGSPVEHPVTDACPAVAAGPAGRVVYALQVNRGGAWGGLLAGGSFPPAAPADGWAVRTPIVCRSVAFLPGGDRFVEVGYSPDGAAVDAHVRGAADGEVVRTLASPYTNNEQVAAGGDWVALRAGPNVFVWGAADLHRPPHRLTTGSRRHFTGLAFHPSGDHLAAVCNDATVRVIACGSWAVVRTLDWKIGRLRSVAFSPDGALAAAGGDGGRTVVWDFDP